MKQTIISSPHYSLCSIKEKLNDQRMIFSSWWLSFPLLLRCVWNDLTLGAWCWHRIASVRRGVEWHLGLQHKVLRNVTRIAEVARSVAKEARRGERVQQQRGCDFREMRRERTNLVSHTRAQRGQKLDSDHHVSNLHSRVHWVLFEMPSSIIYVIFLH